MEDHYATLHVRASASAEEIERAYRRLVKRHHPDLLREASPEARRRAEDLLKRINRAHGVIGDRERRRDYDRDYDRARRGGGSATMPSPRRTAPPQSPVPTPRPTAKRTTHWGGGGPIAIEWETPPEHAPSLRTELFSIGRLLRYAAVIILFAMLLAIIWRPWLGRPSAIATATPAVPSVTVTPLQTVVPTTIPAVGPPAP
ncbi:MAG TPA: J domain-containing protein [Thermomicrobiales bacterium]